MHLIPQPKKLEKRDGTFTLSGTTALTLVGNHAAHLPAARLCHEIEALTGLSLNLDESAAPLRNSINLSAESDGRGEGYALEIRPGSAGIRAQGLPGLFWGTRTLLQLCELCGPALPCVVIEDWPDFPNRGFYHDITRGKVPTLDTLKKLADTCAYYKINQIQLYVEHTFAFRALPGLWAGKDPLSAEEVRQFDAFCRERFIDLVPSLSTFGHLYELIRLPRYEHLNELDIRASRLPHNLYDRMVHYTLDVSQEESFSVMRAMIEEYLPLFGSKYFNICCDETVDLGTGKNRKRAEAQGVGRLYVDFVKRLIALVISHGRIPMFWGDIIMNHPELMSEIPPQAIYLNWNYRPDATEEQTRAFARAGVTQYVCPGVIGWSRFANHIDAASKNIRAMVSYGRKYGAAGVLNTDWGDCCHVNLLASSYHGMILGAALSWNADSYDDALFDKAVSLLQWTDTSLSTAALLRELGDLNTHHLGNIYAWVKGLKGGWNADGDVRAVSGEKLRDNYARAGVIADALAALGERGPARARQDYREFVWSARATQWALALLALRKARELRQDDAWEIVEKNELIGAGRKLLSDYCVLWRARNKESELRNVVATFQAAFKRIRAL